MFFKILKLFSFVKNSLATNRQLLLANKQPSRNKIVLQQGSGLSISGGFSKLKGRTGRERQKRGIFEKTTPMSILSHPIRTTPVSFKIKGEAKSKFLKLRKNSFPLPKKKRRQKSWKFNFWENVFKLLCWAYYRV